MEKGTAINGRVVDEDKNPVADATVVVWVVKRYPKSNQRVELRFESIKSDAKGRWSFANVPEAPDEVEVGRITTYFSRIGSRTNGKGYAAPRRYATDGGHLT